MKQAYRVSLGALGGAVAIALGCGGVGDSDALFSGNAGSNGSGGQSGVSVTSGTSGASVTSGTSGVSTTTGGGDATSSVSTTTASTTTATSTSSTGGGPTILCGSQMCPLTTDSACCFSRYHMPFPQSQCVMGAPGADGCDTSSDLNGLETRITCHDGSQCGAQQFCCGHRTNLNGGQITYYNDVSCADTCAKPDIQLCDPKGPNKCPSQTTCKKSSLLPEGYFVCGG